MNPFLKTAIEAARIGGDILLESMQQDETIQVTRKQKFDFVTQVDLRSEEAIVSYLRNQFPDHQILAEESGGSRDKDTFVWVIDPLDGTKNYIHNFPMFAVSVALLWGDEILVGAVLDPIRDELFYAEKDKGAYLNGSPIKVSENTDISSCLIATGFPFRAKHLTGPYFTAFVSMFHQVSDLRRSGAAALDLAYVACGRLDGFWEIGLNLWDIAAGTLLVQEADGRVGGFFSEVDHLSTGNLIATSGKIHPEIQKHVQNAFREIKF